MNEQPYPLFLFDIDGVLVIPEGYRAAMQLAAAHFGRKFGFQDISLSPDLLIFFEANGITSEFDMLPIILAGMLDVWHERNPDVQNRARLSDYTDLPPSEISIRDIDFENSIRLVHASLRPGEYPSGTVLRLWKEGIVFRSLTSSSLLRDLFEDTREVRRSLPARIFQHFTLGSQLYSRTYNLPTLLDCKSTLNDYDQPQLHEHQRDHLLSLWKNNQLGLAAYTLRPSLPPREIQGPYPGYSPEAEMALRLVGLEAIPLIGYGKLSHFADKAGIEVSQILKPAPAQALAAIWAAWTRTEESSLRSAVEAYQSGYSALPSMMQRSFDVFVFEDSTTGIESVKKAAEILNESGWRIRIFPLGITREQSKAQSLIHAGAQVFKELEDAVGHALSALQHESTDR